MLVMARLRPLDCPTTCASAPRLAGRRSCRRWQMPQMADAASLRLGNCDQSHSYRIKLPGPGTYYWSVQAIDGAFAGGAFAAEETLHFGGFVDINASLPYVGWSAAAWGDYDNDGDLDVLVTGYNGNLGYLSRVYRNDGDDSFTDIEAGLEGVRRAQ